MSRLLLISLMFSILINLSCSTPKKVVDTIVANIATIENSVYPVMAYTPRYLGNMGTAFRIKYHGKFYLITAAHVCSEFDKNPNVLFMIQSHNNQYTINGSYSLPNDDICLVNSMGYQGADYVELDTTETKLGDDLFTIGYPGHPSNEIRGPVKVFEYGKLSGTELIDPDNFKDSPVYMRDLPVFQRQILPGQSGSPIFNKFGRVVGVLIIQNGQGMGIFTPIANLVKFLDEQK